MATAENALWPYMTFEEEGSDPATPASGNWRLYFKAGGLYAVDDGGTVIGPFGTSGSSLSRTQKGTTSAGASFITTRQTYLKKITLASAGFVAGISAFVKGDANSTFGLSAAIYLDNSGTPSNVIAVAGPLSKESDGLSLSNIFLSTTVRAVTIPIGKWLAAGDYWIAIGIFSAASDARNSLAYNSGSGSDRTQTGPAFRDHSVTATSTTSHDFCIYADVLS